MKREVMQMWVDALRSGEYQQGVGELRVVWETGDIDYCCLGVLCDLHRRRTNQGEWLEEGYVPWGASKKHVRTLPEPVRRWAEMRDGNPDMPEKQMTIAELNDVSELPFTELAELIEQNWEAL